MVSLVKLRRNSYRNSAVSGLRSPTENRMHIYYVAPSTRGVNLNPHVTNVLTVARLMPSR